MANHTFNSFESWQEYYFPEYIIEQKRNQFQLPADSLASFLAAKWTRHIIDELENEKKSNGKNEFIAT